VNKKYYFYSLKLKKKSLSGIYIPYDEKYNHRFKRDIYTIHIIDCKDNNNNIITGEYKGELKIENRK
jgi:hypothetical protein